MGNMDNIGTTLMCPAHLRDVLISGPIDYLYVYIYSRECYGEHGKVS